MGEKTFRHMLSTFPCFSIEESEKVREVFHPGKSIRSLRFAKTFRGIDHRKVNQYLLSDSPPNDRVALFGLPEDPEYTIRMLLHPRVSALKMYYSYVEPTAKEIYQCFPPEILVAAERFGIPIILHLPRMIVESQDDLMKVVTDFPALRISIAHLGSTKFVVSGLAEAYRRIAEAPNVSMDTSLNPSEEVMKLAIESFGISRIMYGSDEPLNLIRSRPYVHPEKGQRIVTSYQYHWTDPEEHKVYGHLAKGAEHSHWLCLTALRNAIESLPLEMRDQAKQRIFRKNAEAFFGF